jgi:hypothetical protein
LTLRSDPSITWFRPEWRVLGLTAVAISIVGGLNAFHAWQDYQRGGGHEIWKPILWEYSSIFVAGILALGIYQVCIWLPFNRANWKRRVLQHLGLSLIYSALHVAGMVTIRKGVYFLLGQTYDFGPVGPNFLYELSKDVVSYQWLILLCYSILYYQHLKTLRQQTLDLQKEMAELQLQRLREQLRPHFLFNTLNMISSCMYEDVEKADKLLADLATLLRYSLNKENTSRLPLREEQQFLELYWDLINARFSNQLRLELAIAPGCECALVPCFMLQPLAENAIEHGFRPKGSTGLIKISAQKDHDSLILNIDDDGLGFQISSEEALKKGLGLGNLRAILRQLYGEAYNLSLGTSDLSGAKIEIRIPFQEAT